MEDWIYFRVTCNNGESYLFKLEARRNGGALDNKVFERAIEVSNRFIKFFHFDNNEEDMSLMDMNAHHVATNFRPQIKTFNADDVKNLKINFETSNGKFTLQIAKMV